MPSNRSAAHEGDSSSNDSDAAAAAALVPKRHYVTWSSAAAETLVRLRYDAMQREFAAHTNPLEIAALWTALAAQLQRMSGHKYTSLQCQSKLKALRSKWRTERLRDGKSGSDFESHAIEWIVRANATKRRRERASAALVAARQSRSAVASSDSLSDLLLVSPPSPLVTQRELVIAEPLVLHDAPVQRSMASNDNGHVECDRHRVGSACDDDDEATASEVRETEQALLSLVQRQTRAVEATASCATGRSAQELHAEWLAISREQLQLARDQVELNLFLVRAAPDDVVAHEYLALKRMQARDRAQRTTFAHR